MSFIIAVAGKGGVGKTTLAALILRHLVRRGEKSILMVDADPNSTLPDALRVKVDKTIGQVRQEVMDRPSLVPPGMSKDAYLELMFNQALVECGSYDLLVMGRQEGEGCYCAVNNILHKFLEALHPNYKYIIIDNEAGMEHLSRHARANVDVMFIVSDYSLRGARSAANVEFLVREIGIPAARRFTVVNRAPGELDRRFLEELGKSGLPLAAVIPPDELLAAADIEQQSLLELPDVSPAAAAVAELVDKEILQYSPQ